MRDLPRDPTDPLQRLQPESDHDPSEQQQHENHSAADQALDHKQPVQGLISLAQLNGHHQGPTIANRKRGGAIAQSRTGLRVDREDCSGPVPSLDSCGLPPERRRRAGTSSIGERIALSTLPMASSSSPYVPDAWNVFGRRLGTGPIRRGGTGSGPPERRPSCPATSGAEAPSC